jgi:membrane associated rhomboid family serine protease
MPRSSVVRRIIHLNILVFIGWYALIFTDPNFMITNFLVSWDALDQGRAWTLLTSVFSHNMFIHIFLNMFVLYNFGPIMEKVMGSKPFLIFYLTAGIMGSIGHCLVSAFILEQPELMALGASGAISGVILLFALVFPQQRIYIFGFIPLPAIWAALLIVGLDLIGLFSQTRGSSIPIGHGAHLGGAATGLIYFLLRWRPHRQSTQY